MTMRWYATQVPADFRYARDIPRLDIPVVAFATFSLGQDGPRQQSRGFAQRPFRRDRDGGGQRTAEACPSMRRASLEQAYRAMGDRILRQPIFRLQAVFWVHPVAGFQFRQSSLLAAFSSSGRAGSRAQPQATRAPQQLPPDAPFAPSGPAPCVLTQMPDWPRQR